MIWRIRTKDGCVDWLLFRGRVSIFDCRPHMARPEFGFGPDGDLFIGKWCITWGNPAWQSRSVAAFCKDYFMDQNDEAA